MHIYTIYNKFIKRAIKPNGLWLFCKSHLPLVGQYRTSKPRKELASTGIER